MKKIVLFLFVSFAMNAVMAQGYEISIKLKQLANQEVILGHHFASSAMHPDDTVKLDANGFGILKGKKKLPGGMYFIYMPNKNYFNFFINENQKFYIENDTTDLVKHLKSKGSIENQIFADYQRFLKDKNTEATALREKLKTASDPDKKNIEAQLNTLNKVVNDEMNRVINENSQTLVATFLKANQEIDIPEKFIDENNQLKKEMVGDYFYFMKMHYFDNMNVGDSRLLRTPIFENKINFYLDKVIPQIPDTVMQVVDMLMQAVIYKDAEIRNDYDGDKSNYGYNNPYGNQELMQYILVTLHNKLATSQVMGMEEAFIYEADKYYIKYAVWSNEAYIKSLKEQIKTKAPLLIGKQVKDISMLMLPQNTTAIEKLKAEIEKARTSGMPIYDSYKKDLKAIEGSANFKADSAKLSDNAGQKLVPILETFNKKLNGTTSLYSINSEHILVWFWEESCSHCRKATPKLVEVYNRLKHFDFNVMAVSLNHMNHNWKQTTNEIENWLNFVTENNMQEWINCYDPYHLSKFRKLYDINSSPVPYLLNSNKEIVAKRISVEQVASIIIDLELEKIFKQYDGNERINKYKELLSTLKYIRELDYAKTTLERVLEEEDMAKLTNFIASEKEKAEKVIRNEVNKMLKISDAAQKEQQLKDYADTFFNVEDLEFIISILEEKLNETEKESILKYYKNRVKYKIKED